MPSKRFGYKVTEPQAEFDPLEELERPLKPDKPSTPIDNTSKKTKAINQIIMPSDMFYDIADLSTKKGMTMQEYYVFMAGWFLRNWTEPKPGDGEEYVAYLELKSRVRHRARLNTLVMADRARQFPDDQELADYLSDAAKETDEDAQELLKKDEHNPLIASSRGYRMSRLLECRRQLALVMDNHEYVYADIGLDKMRKLGYNPNLIGKARAEMGIDSIYDKDGRRVWRYYKTVEK